jgi:hypothetical protein
MSKPFRDLLIKFIIYWFKYIKKAQIKRRLSPDLRQRRIMKSRLQSSDPQTKDNPLLREWTWAMV